jgi:peptidoglycan/xylan/chitin deacetylase (PgdA/CDA1 family)
MGVPARIPRWAWGLPAIPVAVTTVWTAALLSTAQAAVAMRTTDGLAARFGSAVALPRRISLSPAASLRADPCRSSTLPSVPAETVQQRFFVDRQRPVVSLTFDDGPSSYYTPRVLDTLRAHGVQATFFVLGRRAETHPEILARIATEGHDIGNHSWSHPSFRSLWKEQIRDEICRTDAVVEAATGLRPALFRPPFGRYAESAVPLVGGLGHHFVLWSVDGADWENENEAEVAQTIVRKARPGSIILLHDREPVTARALPQIIAGLRAKGFEIEKVSTAAGLPATRPAPSPDDR